MALKIAVQMDHPASLNYKSDTSLQLIGEALKRGYEVYFYEPYNLTYNDGQIIALCHKIISIDFQGSKTIYESGTHIDLLEVNVILVRQDPPFNMAYLTNTYLLEKLPQEVLVLNNPKSIRNCPEKLFVLDFAQFMAPTIISRDIMQIKNFIEEHGEVVIKPLYSHGGNDVFFLKQEDKNFQVIIDAFTKLHNEHWIIQKFIKDVEQGDKRIILIDGEIIGAIKRIPSENNIRSNLAAGGKAEKYDLSLHDREICEALKKPLKEMGLFLAGIDIIGDYITEINVTSPTGIIAVGGFLNINIAEIFWDKLEAKLKLL